MKKYISLAIVCISASSALAAQMKDASGNWHDAPPQTISLGGVLWTVPSESWLVENAGWSYPSEAEILERQDEKEQDAIVAESARIAEKPDLLKEAENRFLTALAGWNADHPEQAITTEDGFLQIDAKIEASNLNDVQKLKFSAKLRNYWDLVLFHGGRFGDVQYHPEVQP